MKREWQVVYRVAHAAASAELKQIVLVAEKETEARAVIESQKDLLLVAVLPGRALVDWSKPVFTRDEVAEMFDRSHDFVTREQAKGHLPKSPSGTATFLPRHCTEFVEEGKAA